jgi:hypothetical protein
MADGRPYDVPHDRRPHEQAGEPELLACHPQQALVFRAAISERRRQIDEQPGQANRAANPRTTKTMWKALTQRWLLLMRNGYGDVTVGDFRKKPRLCSRG